MIGEFIEKTWEEIKTLSKEKGKNLQYIETDRKYRIYFLEAGITYECYIRKTDPPSTEQDDFENNYKDVLNKSLEPRSPDGKVFVRAESRPLDMTTCFCGRGDSDTEVGGGVPFIWNRELDPSEEWVAIDSNFVRKIIDFKFKDEVCIKEGALYFSDASFPCQVDFWTYIPAGIISSYDVYIDHFVVSHFFHGTCQMGDELNTECASARIPPYVRHQIWITVPASDIKCKGHITLEIYRAKTV